MPPKVVLLAAGVDPVPPALPVPPAPVVPVLAVSLVGGQTFVYLAAQKGDGYIAHQVPVMLGETVGNTYPVISGLKPGDKVITSGLQFLQEGAPVKPLG